MGRRKWEAKEEELDLRSSEESAPLIKGREAIAEVAWWGVHANGHEVREESLLVATLSIFDWIQFDSQRESFLCFCFYFPFRILRIWLWNGNQTLWLRQIIRKSRGKKRDVFANCCKNKITYLFVWSAYLSSLWFCNVTNELSFDPLRAIAGLVQK